MWCSPLPPPYSPGRVPVTTEPADHAPSLRSRAQAFTTAPTPALQAEVILSTLTTSVQEPPIEHEAAGLTRWQRGTAGTAG